MRICASQLASPSCGRPHCQVAPRVGLLYMPTGAIRSNDLRCSAACSDSSNKTNSGPLRAQEQPQQQGNAMPRTAWNKGVPVSEEVKVKLSERMKEKWQDPEYRDAVSTSLQGREAWNKGKTLSPETRRKMSEAKMNHPVSKETRRKMSEARKGKPLDPKAASLVSEKLKGVPKSEEHRENIAAAMRKRHAAIRVLNAVESVYETTGEHSSKTDLSNMGKKKINSAYKQATSQVLGEFKAELREYRALQEELSPWTEAYVNRHGTKPSMSDVERTGISWLVTRYKRYVLLRERLFTQTHLLRRKLDHASQDPVKGADFHEKQNANRKSINEMAGHASRLQAAAKYKMDKALKSTSSDDSHDSKSHQIDAGTKAPPRVREALQAAMDYRKKKAQETKTAAMMAAAAAAASSSTAAPQHDITSPQE